MFLALSCVPCPAPAHSYCGHYIGIPKPFGEESCNHSTHKLLKHVRCFNFILIIVIVILKFNIMECCMTCLYIQVNTSYKLKTINTPFVIIYKIINIINAAHP
jgi:hypothetical protein